MTKQAKKDLSFAEKLNVFRPFLLSIGVLGLVYLIYFFANAIIQKATWRFY